MASSNRDDLLGATGTTSLYEVSPVPTLVHDPETGSILDVNEACADLWGYDVETLTQMTVSDDGPGIAVSQQERIFEILKQNSNRPDSTGIGLAMSKRIVNWHCGEIWVGSGSDEGATFHFTLPEAISNEREVFT